MVLSSLPPIVIIPVCVSVLVPLGIKGDSVRPVRVPYDARKLRVPACMMEFERCLESIPAIPWWVDPDSHAKLLGDSVRQALMNSCGPGSPPAPRSPWLSEGAWFLVQVRSFLFRRIRSLRRAARLALLTRVLGAWARACGSSRQGGSGADSPLWSSADLAIADCRRRI